MITKPSTEELLEKTNDRYELVTIISKRARQLIDGAEAMIDTNEESKLTIASMEFDEGKYQVKNSDEE